MSDQLFQIALVVKDYDEAILFYTQILDFELLEDTAMSETKRWVVVCPKGQKGCKLLLAKATTEEQLSRVGNQTGGRVFLFMHTDRLDAIYQNLIHHKVSIIREPSVESYGRVFVFADLYGNLWDVIEPI